MKKLICAVFMAMSVLAASAAEGQWLTDFAKAKEQAKKENKVVLLDFTGSDWCPPCMALHKKVFTSDEFKQFAEKNLVLVEVDFPARKKLSDEQKKANAKLQEQFKVEAYPTIILLDPSGKKIGEFSGYGGDSAASYIKKLERAMGQRTS